MQFIILHGSFGKQSDNWFTWLRKQLEADGHTVLAEDFPIEDWDKMTEAGPGRWPVKNQNLSTWSVAFQKKILAKVDTAKPVAVIAHSLSPLFMLHMFQEDEQNYFLSIFVAPFYEKMKYDDWQIEAVNFPFHENKFNWKKIRERAGKSYALYSDNDPYVQAEYSVNFADKMKATPLEFIGAGHFNSDSGWNEARIVLELCRSRYASTIE